MKKGRSLSEAMTLVANSEGFDHSPGDKRAIIFDGRYWRVWAVDSVVFPDDGPLLSCNRPLSNRHETLADVAEVKQLLDLVRGKNDALFCSKRAGSFSLALYLQAIYSCG